MSANPIPNPRKYRGSIFQMPFKDRRLKRCISPLIVKVWWRDIFGSVKCLILLIKIKSITLSFTDNRNIQEWYLTVSLLPYASIKNDSSLLTRKWVQRRENDYSKQNAKTDDLR